MSKYVRDSIKEAVGHFRRQLSILEIFHEEIIW